MVYCSQSGEVMDDDDDDDDDDGWVDDHDHDVGDTHVWGVVGDDRW